MQVAVAAVHITAVDQQLVLAVLVAVEMLMSQVREHRER
jgi:hypothetical protein